MLLGEAAWSRKPGGTLELFDADTMEGELPFSSPSSSAHADMLWHGMEWHSMGVAAPGLADESSPDSRSCRIAGHAVPTLFRSVLRQYGFEKPSAWHQKAPSKPCGTSVRRREDQVVRGSSCPSPSQMNDLAIIIRIHRYCCLAKLSRYRPVLGDLPHDGCAGYLRRDTLDMLDA